MEDKARTPNFEEVESYEYENGDGEKRTLTIMGTTYEFEERYKELMRQSALRGEKGSLLEDI